MYAEHVHGKLSIQHHILPPRTTLEPNHRAEWGEVIKRMLDRFSTLCLEESPLGLHFVDINMVLRAATWWATSRLILHAVRWCCSRCGGLHLVQSPQDEFEWSTEPLVCCTRTHPSVLCRLDSSDPASEGVLKHGMRGVLVWVKVWCPTMP